jgi:hypothetical protein
MSLKNSYIKIKNIRRKPNGFLFHYAHFICDCLFVEIVNDVYKYPIIIREDNINQTIGNFSKMYEDIMSVKNIELAKKEFDCLDNKINILKSKEHYKKNDFYKFRKFIFNRFNIDPKVYIKGYPEVILIKRWKRINLKKNNYKNDTDINLSNGMERRKIKYIYKLNKYLEDKYGNNFKCLILEHCSFEDQIKYFNNCKFLICAHGAALSNIFFCKEKTKILEVTCGKEWEFYDKISKNLNLHHYKCHTNNVESIINLFNLLTKTKN